MNTRRPGKCAWTVAVAVAFLGGCAAPAKERAAAAPLANTAGAPSPAEMFAAWSARLERVGANTAIDPNALRAELVDICARDAGFAPARYDLLVLDEWASANMGGEGRSRGLGHGRDDPYVKLAEADPKFAPAVENAAATWAQSGEIARAVAAYRRIVAADPRNITSRLALARLLLLRDQVAEAMALCRAVLARQGDAIEAFRILAHGSLAQKNPAMAELIVARGLRAAPKDVELHEILVDIAQHRGNTMQAVAALKEVVALSPPIQLQGRVRLATLAQSFGDFGTAAQQMEAILAQRPNDVAATVDLAVSYKGLGRYGQADQLLQRALATEPNNLLALWNRGVLCQKHLADYDAAVAAFTRFADLAPAGAVGAVEVRARLADVARRRDDVRAQAARQKHAQAVAAAVDRVCVAQRAHGRVNSEAVGAEPERIEAAWGRLAEAQRLATAQDLAGADAAAACAFALLPQTLAARAQACAPMHVAWTQILFQAGRVSEAQASIEEAMACDPKNPDARLIAQQLRALRENAAPSSATPATTGRSRAQNAHEGAGHTSGRGPKGPKTGSL